MDYLDQSKHILKKKDMLMSYPVTILTLFPEMFPGVLAHSVVGRALDKGVWSLSAQDMRDFGTGKHRSVDDTPYGGGAGMVIRPDVVSKAIARAKENQPKSKVVFLAPTGQRFTQEKANALSTDPYGIILLCGHYEGIDQRVIDKEVDEVISLGDFVLSGGEPAAMVMLDAVIRLLPDVLGGNDSLHEESFDLKDENGNILVEYPHYTRPETWCGIAVPNVLKSGHHARIQEWRLSEAKNRTEALKAK